MRPARTQIAEALAKLREHRRYADFQRLSLHVARKTWTGLRASELSHDEGVDAVVPFGADGNLKAAFAASLNGDLAKLLMDCKRIRDTHRRPDVLVFATSLPVRETEKRKWKDKVKAEFDWDLEVIGEEHLISVLELPEMRCFCREYLDLDLAEATDPAARIRQASERATASQLPPVPAHFFGRDEELKRGEESIVRTKETHERIFCLNGMPGAGKTAFAIALGHRLKDRFMDGQIFIDLRGCGGHELAALTQNELFRHVILSLSPDLEGTLPLNSDELATLYKRVLAGRPHCLLILDNAKDASQIERLIGVPHAAFIVTSRHKIALNGVVPITLPSLSRDEAHGLLHSLCPALQGSVPEAAELCGWLPLAICVFARIAHANNTYSALELLKKMRNERLLLSAMESAFTLSAHMLEARARTRWFVLSVCPGTFDLNAIQIIWNSVPSCSQDPMTIELARECAQDLVNRNLLQWNTRSGRYALHDLIREFCRSKADPKELSEARQAHAIHFSEVILTLDPLHDADFGQAVNLVEHEKDNLVAGQQFAEKVFRESTSSTERSTMAEVCYIYHNAFSLLFLRISYEVHLDWLNTALAAARYLESTNGEADVLSTLGLLHIRNHKVGEGLQCLEASVALHRSQKNRRRALTISTLLASQYVDANVSFEKSVQALYGVWLGITEEEGGSLEKRICIGALHKLLEKAHIYDLRLTVAELQYNYAAKYGCAIDEIFALKDLASASATVYREREALQYFEKAIALCRAHRDLSVPEAQLADCLHDSARIYYQLGRMNEASRRNVEAKGIYEKLAVPLPATVKQHINISTMRAFKVSWPTVSLLSGIKAMRVRFSNSRRKRVNVKIIAREFSEWGHPFVPHLINPELPVHSWVSQNSDPRLVPLCEAVWKHILPGLQRNRLLQEMKMDFKRQTSQREFLDVLTRSVRAALDADEELATEVAALWGVGKKALMFAASPKASR